MRKNSTVNSQLLGEYGHKSTSNQVQKDLYRKCGIKEEDTRNRKGFGNKIVAVKDLTEVK